MKSNTLRTIFEWALAMSLLLSVIFFIQFFMRTRQERSYQAEMSRFQNTHMMLNMVQNDLGEYAKTHPDLKTFMEAKPAAPAPAPAAKPAK
jgi:hypothetical protein